MKGVRGDNKSPNKVLLPLKSTGNGYNLDPIEPFYKFLSEINYTDIISLILHTPL